MHPDTCAYQDQEDEEDIHHQVADEVEQSPRPFKETGKDSPKGSHVFSLTRKGLFPSPQDGNVRLS
ncbi:Uncharacterised protein [Enterobacter cloacae]|nr:Uncharacterised protein [Enterobacter cloacae]